MRLAVLSFLPIALAMGLTTSGCKEESASAANHAVTQVETEIYAKCPKCGMGQRRGERDPYDGEAFTCIMADCRTKYVYHDPNKEAEVSAPASGTGLSLSGTESSTVVAEPDVPSPVVALGAPRIRWTKDGAICPRCPASAPKEGSRCIFCGSDYVWAVVDCVRCDRKGSYPCRSCKGKGTFPIYRRNKKFEPIGILAISGCNNCGGRGKIWCDVCKGDGIAGND